MAARHSHYRVGIRAGFLPSGFTVCLSGPQSLRMDEDRDAALVYGMQPLIFDRTHRTASLAGWLYDMETIFQICHIEARLQVLLANWCLARDARLWWLTLGEPAIPGGSWADFLALIIARYRPLPDEEANMPYRDPEIYNDMEGLPPEVKQFILAPIMEIPLDDMIDAIMEVEIIAYMLQAAAPADDYLLMLVDDVGIREPVFQGGPILLEDPIPAVPLQEIPPQEAEVDAGDDDMDPTYFFAAPEDNPINPPVIIIASDDDDNNEDIEEQEEDPEKILFDDDDWDVDSDIYSDVTT
ncbi:hypothetical protein TIFTF001_038162 [Ficus carica]|uniref:Uncharacterized protein n=1 Tax=Ficus carica TaxID=3494 RepID=A0AA88E7I3_FICCA|nr:hypothetical protein TIFTF001_038162 [Ficus carica]